MHRILPALTVVAVLVTVTFPPPALGADWPIAVEGTLLVMNKSDDTVTLLGLHTGEPIVTLPTGTEPHEGAVSTDGQIAVIANTDYQSDSGHTLTVIDVPGREVIDTIDLGYGNPHGIQFLPGDGRRVIVTVEGSEAIAIVDVTEGRVTQAIPTPGHPCHMVAAAPGGARAYATSIRRGTLVVLDLEKGEMTGAIETGEGAEGFALSPDGTELWVGNRAADTISIVDTKTLEVAHTLPCEGFPIRVAFAMDGTRVLVSNATAGLVRVFDAEARAELGTIAMPPDSAPIGILVAPDDRHAFVANTRANTVAVIDVEARTLVTTLSAGNTPDGMAWSIAE